MMTLFELGKSLNFDQSFFREIMSLETRLSKDKEDEIIQGLCSKEYDLFYHKILDELHLKENDLLVLKIFLLAALKSYEKYLEKGIRESIYIETMKCFSRFCNEHLVSYKKYGFDRGFWTGRQTSLSLFRLGTLEYEMCEESGIKKIEIHIPSDAILTKEKIDESISLAKDFFKTYFPEYKDAKYYCHTWLLSPTLVKENMLSKDSHILIFMSYFNIVDSYPSNDYLEWVYKDRYLKDLSTFKCITSLQSKLKQYIIKDNEFLNGIGELKQ